MNDINLTQAHSDPEVPVEELGRVYSACRLAEAGISFSAFCDNPWHTLVTQGQEGAIESLRKGFEPLLPAQAAIARRLRDEDAHEPVEADA